MSRHTRVLAGWNALRAITTLNVHDRRLAAAILRDNRIPTPGSVGMNAAQHAASLDKLRTALEVAK